MENQVTIAKLPGIPAPLQALVPLGTRTFHSQPWFAAGSGRINLGSQVTCWTCCLNPQGLVSILRDSRQTLRRSPEMLLVPAGTQPGEVVPLAGAAGRQSRDRNRSRSTTTDPPSSCGDLTRVQRRLRGSAVEFPLVAAMLGATRPSLCTR